MYFLASHVFGTEQDVASTIEMQMLSYLGSQFKLDLIHEDESIGVKGLWPAQKHPVLVALPGHRTGDVVSLFWRTTWRTVYQGDHRGHRLDSCDRLLYPAHFTTGVSGK